MTESSVLVASTRTKPSSAAAFAFLAALRRLEPGRQVTTIDREQWPRLVRAHVTRAVVPRWSGALCQTVIG